MRGTLIQNNDTSHAAGRLVICTGKENLLQRLKIKLVLRKGEIPWFPNVGSDWDSILSEGRDSILAEIRRVVLSFSEITQIRTLEISEYVKSEKNLKITLIADSIYGTVTL